MRRQTTPPRDTPDSPASPAPGLTSATLRSERTSILNWTPLLAQLDAGVAQTNQAIIPMLVAGVPWETVFP